MISAVHFGSQQQKLLMQIMEDKGVDDISKIPFLTFDNAEKINYKKVRGNIHLMNKKIVSVKESENYLKRIGNLIMP